MIISILGLLSQSSLFWERGARNNAHEIRATIDIITQLIVFLLSNSLSKVDDLRLETELSCKLLATIPV